MSSRDGATTRRVSRATAPGPYPAGPVQVTGLTNATQVAAGARFSLAVHTVLSLLGA